MPSDDVGCFGGTGFAAVPVARLGELLEACHGFRRSRPAIPGLYKVVSDDHPATWHAAGRRPLTGET
jgi:hypothetical protein